MPPPQRDFLLLIFGRYIDLDELDAVFQLSDHFHVAAVGLQSVQQRVERRQIPAAPLGIVIRPAVVPAPNGLLDRSEGVFDLGQIVRQGLLCGRSERRGADACHRAGHSTDRGRQCLVVNNRDVIPQALYRVDQIVPHFFGLIIAPSIEGVDHGLGARGLPFQRFGNGHAAVVKARDRHCNLVALDRRHGKLVGGVDDPFRQQQASDLVGGALGLGAFGRQCDQVFQIGSEITILGVLGAVQPIQGRLGGVDRRRQVLRRAGDNRHGFVQATFQCPIPHAVGDALPSAVSNRQGPFPQFVNFRAVSLQLLAHQVDVDLVDHVGRVIEHAGEVG